MFEEILLSTLRLSIPLILVAYSGLFSERGGTANIGLESQLIASAFTAAAFTSLFGSPFIGILGGLLGAVVASSLFAFFCIHGKGDDIVVGTAMNIFVIGLVPVLNKSMFGITGSTPSLEIEMRLTSPVSFGLLVLFVTVFIHFIFNKTVWGLRINAAGENPDALITQGISAVKTRYQSVIFGSLFAGCAGIYISICQSSGYVRNMSAGRGYMALAALILGGWKPLPTAGACLVFSLFDAIQMRLQGLTSADLSGTSLTEGVWTIPNQFIQILPYIMTLLGLAFFGARMKAPRAINRKLDI